MTEPRGPRRGALHLACACGLALVLWVQASAIRQSSSATFDETIYLELARDVAHGGRFDELIQRGMDAGVVLGEQ